MQSDGNPVAVHVMDGSFLVSFDMAVKGLYICGSEDVHDGAFQTGTAGPDILWPWKNE